MMCYMCTFCGKTFDDRNKFAAHIRRLEKNNFNNKTDLIRYICEALHGKEKTNLIIDDYIEEKICASDIPKEYQHVLQLIALLGIKRTQSEEKNTKRYKEKYANTLKQRYGDNITNVSQIPEVRNKINSTLEEKYGSLESYYQKQLEMMSDGYKIYCSDEGNKKQRTTKMEATCKTRYGVTNPAQSVAARTKNSKSQKKRFENMTEDQRRQGTELARKALNFESSLEKRIKKCLIDLDEDFLPHVFLWRFNYDIMLSDKILIEVQGDFWHANPKKYKSTDILLGGLAAQSVWDKDKKKFEIARKNGYTVIAIWEDEIRNKNEEELSLYVLERIENVRSNQ